MPAAPATKAAIQRAIDAVRACGLTVSGVSVSRDGTVHVDTSDKIPVDSQPEVPKVLEPKAWAKPR
ncbi:MAG: hypothetical protein AAF092_05270 [Pseudomonadota bacterium]